MLRKVVLLGATAAVLTPLVTGVLAAPGYAAAGTASLVVDAPGVLGVGGGPAEFTATFTPPAGDEAPAERVGLVLRPVLGEDLVQDPAAPQVDLEFFDPAGGAWQDVVVGADGRSAPLPFPAGDGATTVRLRAALSIPGTEPGSGGDDPTMPPAAELRDLAAGAATTTAATTAAAPAGSGFGQSASLPGVPDFDFCTMTSAAFTLHSTAVPVPDAEPAGTGRELAADVDEVLAGTASVDLGGVPARVEAGGGPQRFDFGLCNRTDSPYAEVGRLLALGRGSVEDGDMFEGRLPAAGVVLEAESGGTWVRVPLTEVDGILVADFAGLGPVALAPRTDGRLGLRLSFGKGVTPGPVSMLGVAMTGGDEMFAGLDFAELQVVAAAAKPVTAPTPVPRARPVPPRQVSTSTGTTGQLAATGGQHGTAALGGVLLVAGAVLVALTYRRRPTS